MRSAPCVSEMASEASHCLTMQDTVFMRRPWPSRPRFGVAARGPAFDPDPQNELLGRLAALRKS